MVLSDDHWKKRITNKPVVTAIPTIYVTQSALIEGGCDDGKQIACVNFWVLGNREQFREVIKQHHL